MMFYVVLSTVFTVVNNSAQRFTRFLLNNIIHYSTTVTVGSTTLFNLVIQQAQNFKRVIIITHVVSGIPCCVQLLRPLDQSHRRRT